jgi:cyclopropane fatty-acyl-phospholipid synthase-like methyltransferase
MRRVNPSDIGVDQDNYHFHLARYLFVARQLQADHSVLEIGCGAGYGARLLADTAKHVYAQDAEKDLQESWKAYAKPNLTFSTDLPDSGTFDCVVSLEVVEHIEPKDVPSYMETVKRYMSPTGFAVISTPRALPFEERSKNRQEFHAYEYSPDEFKALLHEHFENVFVFGQNDGIISIQNLGCTWNMIAICTQQK